MLETTNTEPVQDPPNDPEGPDDPDDPDDPPNDPDDPDYPQDPDDPQDPDGPHDPPHDPDDPDDPSASVDPADPGQAERQPTLNPQAVPKTGTGGLLRAQIGLGWLPLVAISLGCLLLFAAAALSVTHRR